MKKNLLVCYVIGGLSTLFLPGVGFSLQALPGVPGALLSSNCSCPNVGFENCYYTCSFSAAPYANVIQAIAAATKHAMSFDPQFKIGDDHSGVTTDCTQDSQGNLSVMVYITNGGVKMGYFGSPGTQPFICTPYNPPGVNTTGWGP